MENLIKGLTKESGDDLSQDTEKEPEGDSTEDAEKPKDEKYPMAYTTELMENILSGKTDDKNKDKDSKSARQAIQRVTHKYGDAYTVIWLFRAIGLQYDKYFEYVDRLKYQVIPETSDEWAISYWERSLGLIEDKNLEPKERIQRITNKKSQRLPMNPRRLEDALKNLCPWNVTVEEGCGKNRFSVVVDVSDSDTQFSNKDVAVLRKEIKRRKPCQLVFNLIYQSNSNIILNSASTCFQRLQVTSKAGAKTYNEYKNFEHSDMRGYTYYELLCLGGIK